MSSSSSRPPSDPALALEDTVEMALRPAALIAGRYRVVERLGRGGMGRLYKVIDDKTDRLRALKVMRSEIATDADMRSRFENEARVVGRVRSDHIVEVVDAGVVDQTPFLVMELLVGEDLATALEREGALPLERALDILRGIATGLDKVHAESVVHRDLKPENIFLCRRDDASELVKLIDFGIAKQIADFTSPKTTRSLGTPMYMAPEQLTGDGTIDGRADVYALGHIAFTLLIGRPYWQDEAKRATTPFAFANTVLRGLVEPASARAKRHQGALPEGFDAWFERAVAIEPEARWESAGTAIDELLGSRAAGPGVVPASEDEREPRKPEAEASGERRLAFWVVAMGAMLAAMVIWAPWGDDAAGPAAPEVVVPADPSPVEPPEGEAESVATAPSVIASPEAAPATIPPSKAEPSTMAQPTKPPPPPATLPPPVTGPATGPALAPAPPTSAATPPQDPLDVL